MPNFTGDWITEDSFEETLISLINMADPGCLADRSPQEIISSIMAELQFICLYDEEMVQVQEFLNSIATNPKHRLWKFAREH